MKVKPYFSTSLRRAAHGLRLRGPLSEDPTARMFHVLLLTVTIWIGLGWLVNLPNAPVTFRRVLYPLLLESCQIAALVLIRRGQFRGASLVYLAGTWLWTTLCVSGTGGIRSAVLILYGTLPISAAWLLGYQPALWTAASCVVAMAVFLCLEMIGMSPQRTVPGTPLGIWILAVQATLIGTIPVGQVIKRLLGTLAELQRYKQDLELLVQQRTAELVQARDQAEAANAHLEERVAERTAELRESEERFRNMADTAPVLIWVAGPDKLRTFFNRAWLTFAGRPMEQELGNGWADRIHPEDLDSWSATYASAFESHSPFRIEYRMRRADGEYRYLLSAGVPRFQSDGAFAGYIGSSVDITELKQAQQRALAGQKLESLGLLATSIAHDFNNLLGAILSSAELALMERAEGSSWEEELQRIKAAAVCGAQIVSELMIFGAKESPAFEPVDCALLVREMSQITCFLYG